MTDPLLFLLAALTILGTPGPTNTLLATGGATAGVRASLPLLVGELGGYLIAIAAIRLVLGPVLASYPLLANGLKATVALYLCWVAIDLWRRAGAAAGAAQLVTVRRVFIATLLNPKALIFALSVIPAGGVEIWRYLLVFCVCVSGCGFGWILVGQAAGAAAGTGGRRLLPRAGAIVLAAFAGFILYSAFARA